MNIILLDEHELGRTLPRRDSRTIHLLKVLHKKQGDTFDAGILGGMCGTGKIEKINFDGSIFITIDGTFPPPDRVRFRVAVAYVRPIQMRRLFRELSNFGVPYIDLLGTDLGDKSYRNTKMLTDGGAAAAFIEGAVQARDTRLPVLTVYESLDIWLKERPWVGGSRVPLLLAMDNVRPEGSFFNISQSGRPCVIAVGPERGWSDRERDLFEKAGFSRLSMGSRALRTETACVAASALAMEKTQS